MKTEFACFAAAKPIRIPARVPGGRPEFHPLSKITPQSSLRLGVTVPHAPTNRPGLQAPGLAVAPEANTGPAQRVLDTPKRPPLAPHRLVLRGDPALLRRLRAAEMEAWEAFEAGTLTAQATTESNTSARLLRPGSAVSSRTETLLLLTLGAAAAVGVMVGLVDLHDLLDGWARFASGIQSLLS
jgi:hypothetical protein